MTDVTLWHNPRCSKSRGALDLLRGRGIEPAIRDYVHEPPTPGELRTLLGRLGIPARALLRSSEQAYLDLGLGDLRLDEARLVSAMCAEPRLIERPILVVGNRAVVGRPPDRVLELL